MFDYASLDMWVSGHAQRVEGAEPESTTFTKYAWSPRWPAKEMARRIYAFLQVRAVFYWRLRDVPGAARDGVHHDEIEVRRGRIKTL